jgi:hypothetical protein
MPMSQNLVSKTPATNGAASTETASVQLALRLRASDNSDRAIVSNVSAVQAGSGMVLIDFGFVEQRAIEEMTRAMRAGQKTSDSIDGRLECRVAMSLGDIAQLSRQLQQALAAASQQMAPVRSDLESAIAPGPDTGLQ